MKHNEILLEQLPDIRFSRSWEVGLLDEIKDRYVSTNNSDTILVWIRR